MFTVEQDEGYKSTQTAQKCSRVNNRDQEKNVMTYHYAAFRKHLDEVLENNRE